MSARLSLVHDDWQPMASAPKDGTVIRIKVGGSDGTRGSITHEFRYPVMWHEGRWCFAKNKSPLFPWQTPLKWRPA